MSIVPDCSNAGQLSLVGNPQASEERTLSRLQQLCPSFDSACGVGNFARNLETALTREGVSVATTTTVDDVTHGNLLIQHEFALYDVGLLKAALRTHVGRSILLAHSPKADVHYADYVDGFVVMSEGMTTAPKPTIVLPHPGWQVLPLLDRDQLKADFGWSKYRCVVGTNGFISPSRQFDRVLERFMEFAAANDVLVNVNCPRHHSHNDRPGYRDQEERLLHLASLFPGNLLLCFDFVPQQELNKRFQACDLLWCWTAAESKPYGSGTCSDQYGSGTRVIVTQKQQHCHLFSLPNVAVAPSEIEGFVQTMMAEVSRGRFDRHDPSPLAWSRFAQRFAGFINGLPFRDRPIPVVVPIQPVNTANAVDQRPKPRKMPDKMTARNAASAASCYLKSIDRCPTRISGRGIVICSSGIQSIVGSWVLINLLRAIGCKLSIELWCFESDVDKQLASLVSKYDVVVRSQRDRGPRSNSKWRGVHLKTAAVLKSSFREALVLDSDTVPAHDPTYLFSDPSYSQRGALFWLGQPALIPRSGHCKAFGITARQKLDHDMGRFLVDKSVGWSALHLSGWYGRHAHFFEQYLPSGRGVFQLAWQKLGIPYSGLLQKNRRPRGNVAYCDPTGKVVFQKSSVWLPNLPKGRRAKELAHEDLCRSFISALLCQWSALGYFMRFSKDCDRDLAAALRDGLFDCACPRNAVPALRLGHDGIIVSKRESDLTFWWVEHEQLVLADSGGRVLFRCERRNDAEWSGASVDRADLILELKSRN